MQQTKLDKTVIEQKPYIIWHVIDGKWRHLIRTEDKRRKHNEKI